MTTLPDWPSLWEREPALRPEALGKPGELQFEAVRRDDPVHIGIPWAQSMLTKEPGFTIRHQNDIDMAQRQLADAKTMLDRAYAAICRDAAVRWLHTCTKVSLEVTPDSAPTITIDIGHGRTRSFSHDQIDYALLEACRAILDARPSPEAP